MRNDSVFTSSVPSSTSAGPVNIRGIPGCGQMTAIRNALEAPALGSEAPNELGKTNQGSPPLLPVVLP